MDHAEALDLIEVAAVEPGGLDRLIAGDTADAAALAGHLAACASCARELVAVGWTSEVARGVISTTLDPALRERTLAHVRAVGRPRNGTDASVRVAATPAARPSPRRPRLLAPLGWAASIGATAILAAGLAVAVVGSQAPAVDPAAEALARVTVATLRVEGDPAAERVSLAPTGAADTRGTLVFSRATGELVVVATDLAPPPPGMEYRCWVETEDGRRRMGRMFFGGGIAYWVGPVEGLDIVGPGARFGVSLVDLAAEGADGDPVLVGELAEAARAP